MIRSHLESRFETIIDAYVCNMCGDELENRNGAPQILASGGYGSVIGDGALLTFSFCEQCLIKLFKQFKHQPTIDSDGLGGLASGVVEGYVNERLCEGCDQDCQRDCGRR